MSKNCLVELSNLFQWENEETAHKAKQLLLPPLTSTFDDIEKPEEWVKRDLWSEQTRRLTAKCHFNSGNCHHSPETLALWSMSQFRCEGSGKWANGTIFPQAFASFSPIQWLFPPTTFDQWLKIKLARKFKSNIDTIVLCNRLIKKRK